MKITAVACPPPIDWCFDCAQIMFVAGDVYVCERCGNVTFKASTEEE